MLKVAVGWSCEFVDLDLGFHSFDFFTTNKKEEWN